MKRIFKIKIRSGFTLLETLLSVAIMVIISTMLLNGFAATMGYSYHTSVYTKAAAVNYGKCMNTLSELHSNNEPYAPTGGAMLANNYAVVGEIAYNGSGTYNDSTSTSNVTIAFAKGPATTSVAGTANLNDLNAVEFAYTAIPSGVELSGVIGNGSVAANRKTFFYIPTKNYDPSAIVDADNIDEMINDAYLGHVGIYKINSNTFGAGVTSGEYCWGYLANQSNPSSFVAIGTSFPM